MRNKLVSIKRIIEDEIGERIDTKNRRRDLTYARAVYCRVGRDMNMSLSAIGKVINRDHATVLHTLRNVYPFAQKEVYYNNLYESISEVMMLEQAENVRKTDEENKREFSLVKRLSNKVIELQKKNDSLKHQLLVLTKNERNFTQLFEGLREEDVEEVYNKMSIFVKVIKSRVYL